MIPGRTNFRSHKQLCPLMLKTMTGLFRDLAGDCMRRARRVSVTRNETRQIFRSPLIDVRSLTIVVVVAARTTRSNEEFHDQSCARFVALVAVGYPKNQCLKDVSSAFEGTPTSQHVVCSRNQTFILDAETRSYCYHTHVFFICWITFYLFIRNEPSSKRNPWIL